MIDSIVFGAIVLLCATAANTFDVTEKTVEHIVLTENDIIKKEDLDNPKTRDNKREQRFIGDLVLGEPMADETVFRRTMEISNPTDQVYNSAVNLNVERGVIHYLSVKNERNSYAVACDEPYSLGTSRISFKVRVPPNTKSNLSLFVAAH